MSRLVGVRDGVGSGWEWFVTVDEQGRKRPRRWTFLPLLAALAALAFAGFLILRDAGDTSAAPLSGAIFTTTPNGGIVNENVHYNRKIEVYLDGGPGPNAPQTAAGLPDGDYVFQVTDPPGKVLLSQDAAKCRVLRVANGVIVALRDKTDGSFVDHTASDACHVNDGPEGAAGATGKHDTNTDTDHGPPAIVVQLMPFFDTPNPGGVYKAWVMPVTRYLSNGGNLEAAPVPQCTRNGRPANNCNGGAVQIGFERDAGFGPPRDQVKTDNFKVKEFFPPEITVRKFHDINGDGVWQTATEPEIGVNQCVDDVTGAIISCPGGWPYDFTEPVDGGTVTNTFHTPHTHVAGIPGTYTACEFHLPGWAQSAAYLDGVKRNADQCVPVAVAGTSGEHHEIIFGNFRPPEKHGQKFIDLNGNGRRDAGEGCPTSPSDVNYAGCVDVIVNLDGNDNAGGAVHLTTRTCGASVACPAGEPFGSYWFTGLKPGSYRVSVVEPPGFECSFPSPCRYDITLISGDIDTGNDFGDFSRAEVHGRKFIDLNGNGQPDPGEGCPSSGPNVPGCAGVTVRLDGTDGTGAAVHLTTTTNATGEYGFMDLRPGSYTVTVTEASGFVCSFPHSCSYTLTLTSDQVVSNRDFGDVLPPEKHGQKFIDLNANGRRDAGEDCPTNPSDVDYAGCVDVAVNLDGNDNTGGAVHLTTRTCGASVACPAGEPLGSYWFTGLKPGSYRVSVVEPPGFECSFPNPCRYDITLLSGDIDTGNDFGDFSRAEVHGVKFFDHNGNGSRDANDEGIADVEIQLDGTDGRGAAVHLFTFTCGGTRVVCPTGEEVGSFWFMDLIPGTYTVSEVVPSGFTQTAPLPVPPGVFNVTLTSDQVCEHKDFGNFAPCAGLTPGFWFNWRNHYTQAQFLSLLQGTIAQGSVATADLYLTSVGCDNGDALACMRRFQLSDQLTLNLTASTDPNLFRPAGAGLIGLCSIPGVGTLRQAIADGLAILGNPSGYTRDQILGVKDRLAAFANL